MTSMHASALLLLSVSLAAPSLPGNTIQAQSNQSHKLDDPTIVAIFDAANTADMETSALAEKHAASEEVRDFGAMLVRDHRMVRQQGRDLAAKLGVTPTPPKDDQSAKDHAAAMARLGSLQGAEFDRAFLQHEAAFHQSVIDAVTTTLLPSIENPELKALVQKVAPAFQAHLKMAQELEKKIAGAKAGDRASR
jgi:putative membrane protein